MAELINRVALVIGASRGIGAAIAIALGHAGTAVAVNYRDEAAQAKSVADERPADQQLENFTSTWVSPPRGATRRPKP
jgi:NAD(P)-dependent dehydrogenase (short-subunit alcohol dehydrogenase family)